MIVHRIKICFSLIIIILLNYSLVLAQDKDSLHLEELFEMSLNEIMNISVITTSRTQNKELAKASATVIVITSKQIDERCYQSLLDVLYDLPDIKIDYGVDPRWMNDVTIRGIRGMDKFIILLDGVRISSPTNEVIAIMENYPVHFAQQIEVVYGPASALYGADAFSGVINIISKKPQEDAVSETTISGGMYNTLTANAYTHKKFNNSVSLTLAAQYFYDQQPDLSKYYKEEYVGMDQELSSGTFNTINGPITPETKVDPNKSSLLKAYGLYAGLRVKDFKFTYFGNMAQHPTTIANSPHNSVYNESAKFVYYINMGNISYIKEFGKLTSTTTATYSRYNLDPQSNFRNVWTEMEPGYVFAYGWKAKAEQLLTWKLKDELILTGGATYESYEAMPRSNDFHYPVNLNNTQGVIVNTITINNPEGIDANLDEVLSNYSNIGGLLQIQYDPFKKLLITLGARIDNDSRYGNTLNPRISIIYQPSSKTTVKGFFGSAFLAPSPQYMYDRYGTFVTNDEGLNYYSYFFQMPNPDLKPQKTKTAELSIKSFLTDELSLTLTSFYSNITGLISPVSNTDKVNELYPDLTYNGYQILRFPDHYYVLNGDTLYGDGIQINDNMGVSKVYGGTAQLNYFTRFSSKTRVNLYAAYSYIDGYIDIDEDGPIKKRNLPSVSPHTFKLGCTFNYKDFSISPRIIFVGEQRVFNTLAIQENDETKYQTINGYQLVNLTATYNLKSGLKFFLIVKNLLNQKYRNVNIGAAPETYAGGSASAEFVNGAPQNPIRITGGFQLRF
ncbi:TonB-dependent receptor plug domain-containing protein [Bacteroidota bacterium]